MKKFLLKFAMGLALALVYATTLAGVEWNVKFTNGTDNYLFVLGVKTGTGEWGGRVSATLSKYI